MFWDLGVIYPGPARTFDFRRADSYHSGAHTLPIYTSRVRPTVFAINIALYIIQVCAWATYEGMEGQHQPSPADSLSLSCAALHAATFMALAALLGFYARRIITQHGRTAGIPLRVRQRQMCTIAGASIPIAAAFVVRAAAILVAGIGGYL